MMTNDWIKRIRELECERACYAIKERELVAKIDRMTVEIEALKKEIRRAYELEAVLGSDRADGDHTVLCTQSHDCPVREGNRRGLSGHE